eukprot:2707105-Pyramimonas_sp.AAC.1
MQRAMWPARLGRAGVHPDALESGLQATCAPNTLRSAKMGSRPCSRARAQQVAPQVQAAVAPDYAMGLSHK